MKSLRDLSLNSDAGWKSFISYRSQALSGLLSGLPELDKFALGLSGIVGIQGEPGSCKSTFALQMATFSAAQGVPVLMIDRENGEHRLRQRILSQLNLVSRSEVLRCELPRLRELHRAVAGLPFYVETSYQVTLEIIEGYLKEMQEVHKAKQMLLIVDSLQALPKRKDDERMALQEWIEGLDQLKLNFGGNLVILMTSEKSRGKYETASKDAGKGTGSIEFKCEQLIDMREMKNSPLIALQLVKNRDGSKSPDIYLAKQLAYPRDPNSFVFKLRAAELHEINLPDESDSF